MVGTVSPDGPDEVAWVNGIAARMRARSTEKLRQGGGKHALTASLGASNATEVDPGDAVREFLRAERETVLNIAQTLESSPQFLEQLAVSFADLRSGPASNTWEFLSNELPGLGRQALLRMLPSQFFSIYLAPEPEILEYELLLLLNQELFDKSEREKLAKILFNIRAGYQPYNTDILSFLEEAFKFPTDVRTLDRAVDAR